METLEDTRRIDGAIQDEYGHYFVMVDGVKRYGFRSHFAGTWVCYTDGVYCACHDFCDCPRCEYEEEVHLYHDPICGDCLYPLNTCNCQEVKA